MIKITMFTSVAISKTANRLMSLTNIAYIIDAIDSISVMNRMDSFFIVCIFRLNKIDPCESLIRSF